MTKSMKVKSVLILMLICAVAPAQTRDAGVLISIRHSLMDVDKNVARCDREGWPMMNQKCIETAAAVGKAIMLRAKALEEGKHD